MKTKMLALFSMLATFLLASTAFAQEAVEVEVAVNQSKMFAYLAAGIGMGLAAFGGSLGQGRASAAALEGIARNPGASGQIFVPMILGLALIESLVIYALIISFVLALK
ncbi:MAG: ATP synthase F0 subunit C [Sandaracinaceae bacterium]